MGSILTMNILALGYCIYLLGTQKPVDDDVLAVVLAPLVAVIALTLATAVVITW